MFKKILIANRGEIACRIAKTCKELGIKSVGVYSDVDAESLHAKACDQIVPLGGNEAKDTYLSIPKIIDACKKSGAEAVHPGYGFLSENSEFARALAKNKITFIGPKAETIDLMGNKVAAKELAKKCNVPLVPGISSEDKVEQFIAKFGFPILVKAAAGGGGRGMRKVFNLVDLKDALAGAKREAETFFNDGSLFIEKLIENGRHIEVQIFGDSGGNVIHLFDRDCTVQRKHQKVIEEAPVLSIDPAIRKKILDDAVRLGKESGYIGAGTVEFILAPDNSYYFLEVNSRLQVEHPVTEQVTGLDLVELQIRVASGEKLDTLVDQGKIKTNSHAIECRICAESPEDNFTTTTGTILDFRKDFISGIPGIRIDTGFGRGDKITHYYDSLLAKLIVTDSDRNAAITKTILALKNLHILGIKTNIPFLLQILNSVEFKNSSFHTNLAESLIPDLETLQQQRALVGALYVLSKQHIDNSIVPDAWSDHFAWRQYNPKTTCSLTVNNAPTTFIIEHNTKNSYRILDAQKAHLYYHLSNITPNNLHNEQVNGISFLLEGRKHGCSILSVRGRDFISTHLGLFEITPLVPSLASKKISADKNISGEITDITAPFPGKVVAIKMNGGDQVEQDSTLIILESMKMEHLLKAPCAGQIKEITVKEGDIIESGKILLSIICK